VAEAHTGEKGDAFMALVRPMWKQHPSNADILSLKRKELQESHHVSLCAPLLVTSILLPYLYLYLVWLIYFHIDKIHLSCISREFSFVLSLN
jgi:hypothetical protein